jgi:two-component system response regulator
LEVLDYSKVKLKINVVEDGEKALDYLRQNGNYNGVRKPDLILLDLNMPRKSGREALAEIKKDRELRSIPVVILTTSEAEEDISNTYHLGASCYITKPVGLEQFQKVVQAVENFWFTVVKFPPKS